MPSELHSLANAYNLPTRLPAAEPSATPAPSFGGTPPDLESMLTRYERPESVYGPQLEEALTRSRSESKAFNDMIQAAIDRKEDTGPSKAELYFRLAAAFGAPTKTGSFFESLGNASGAAGEHFKQQREAEAAQRNKKLELGITRQKVTADEAKTEVGNLRALAAGEMSDARAMQAQEAADRRAVALKKYELYIKSGQPQSEAGKYAMDLGHQPGSPEYQAAVKDYITKKMENGDLFKQAQLAIASAGLGLQQQKFAQSVEQSKKLSPGETKLLTETEDALSAIDSALANLDKAYKLNPNSFDTSAIDTIQRKALEFAGSTDPKLVNTREIENLLSRGAVGNLRVAFGGNPTEGERKILLDLEGIGAKSIQERERIMMNTARALRASRQRQAERLQRIKEGSYRETQQTPNTEAE